MNRWNILHALAPFSALFTALLLLNKMPNLPIMSNWSVTESSYSPLGFIFFSLIPLVFAVFFPLRLPEIKGNFLFFFIMYPLWFMGAIAPLFASHPYYGALASWFIFILTTIAQIILAAMVHDYNID